MFYKDWESSLRVPAGTSKLVTCVNEIVSSVSGLLPGGSYVTTEAEFRLDKVITRNTRGADQSQAKH